MQRADVEDDGGGCVAMVLSDEESLRLSEELRLSDNTSLPSLRWTGGDGKEGQAPILDEDGVSCLILGLRSGSVLPEDNSSAWREGLAAAAVPSVPCAAPLVAPAVAPAVAAAPAPAHVAADVVCEWTDDGAVCGAVFGELAQLGRHLREAHIAAQKKNNRVARLTGSRCYWRGCERPPDKPFNSTYNLELHLRFQHTGERPFVCQLSCILSFSSLLLSSDACLAENAV